jgi:hypothetical protein
MSNDDSFIVDENEEYDESNAYDFRQGDLKTKTSNLTQTDFQNARNRKIQEIKMIAESIKEFMKKLKNLQINVRKVHVRCEDDYFEFENPFSFGIIADEIIFDTDDARRHRDSQNPNSGLVEKLIDVFHARIYWNSMSETFVPTSLWEQTKDLEFRIFEAIAADDLYELMYEPFQQNSEKQYFSNKDELILPFDLRMNVKFF